jgi:NAD(P)-dependent dehydrogenase (short-subunit alcohol dehydrogenase family)
MTDSLFTLSGSMLITGGTRGIGRAISFRFARAGANVIANYIRDEKAAQELKCLATQEGLSIELCRADLTTQRGLEQIERAANDAGKPFCGFVHCAATGVHHPIAELTKRHLEWTFSLNVVAFFELIKILMPYFSKPSSVVVVSSPGARRALPYYSVVGSSKGALEALARHFAAELAPQGIRINILVPGTVLTDVWKAIPDSGPRLAEAARRAPIGRLVTPDEVASAAQFLCSKAASGIVGHTLFVDGGAGIIG